MNIETFISDAVRRSVEALYGELGDEQLQIQKTRKEFEGDYTLVTFPLLRRSRKSPEATATEIGEYMTANIPEIKAFNVIKGFPEPLARQQFLGGALRRDRCRRAACTGPHRDGRTRRPGARNNLLGYSVAQILKVRSSKPSGERPRHPHLKSMLWRGSSTATNNAAVSSINNTRRRSVTTCWSRESSRRTATRGQSGERPRYPHLQVDAGVEGRRRNARFDGHERRCGQILRGVRQTLQGSDQGARGAGTVGGRG